MLKKLATLVLSAGLFVAGTATAATFKFEGSINGSSVLQTRFSGEVVDPPENGTQTSQPLISVSPFDVPSFAGAPTFDVSNTGFDFTSTLIAPSSANGFQWERRLVFVFGGVLASFDTATRRINGDFSVRFEGTIFGDSVDMVSDLGGVTLNMFDGIRVSGGRFDAGWPTLNDGSVVFADTVAPVPLPATAPLFFTGLLGFAWFRRRQKRAVAA